MGGNPCGAGEQRDEEGVAETRRYEQTTTPIPHAPVQTGMSLQRVQCPTCQPWKDVSENVQHLRCDWMQWIV